eukprot:TRINITY_DN6428_c0_g1_i1.p1 TRINITY_DN6428_c0_g1~~TRINITY_DN6428_c0_g1_i1.p1  ORF type:complete len:649 (-),score=162.06 TRINITY_DN6428_c0_g1_i1:175-2121(-)
MQQQAGPPSVASGPVAALRLAVSQPPRSTVKSVPLVQRAKASDIAWGPTSATAAAAAAAAAAVAAATSTACGSRLRSRRNGRPWKGQGLTAMRASWPVWQPVSDPVSEEVIPDIDVTRFEEDISTRPERKIVKELARYEDPDDPERPPALPRPRSGRWAPPLPEPTEPREAFVVGIGRQLRSEEDQGPRARLGAAAVEALQQRYGVQSHFDLEARGYMAQCRASLDKSGRAGVQKINLFQPVSERPNEMGDALWPSMQRAGLQKAMVLFVFSDWRLPFGQLRIRSAYNEDDDRIRSAYTALTPKNTVNCLHIGVGRVDANEELLPAEAAALPQVLANAASAIEVWLSEADIGLVMRFVNRPEAYEMPPGWPYNQVALPGAQTEALPEGKHAELPEGADEVEASSDSTSLTVADVVRDIQAADSSALPAPAPLVEPEDLGSVLLFDLNRDNQSASPNVSLVPMSVEDAVASLAERPSGDKALIIAGRRHASFEALKDDLVEMVITHGEPGMHLRVQDDQDAVRALLTYHPDGDRLLEDCVAVKVDCSPVDDDTRCLWVIKFDGHEEDVSLKTCLSGLQDWLKVDGVREGNMKALPSGHKSLRLGAGRWSQGLRTDTSSRAKVVEKALRKASKEKQQRRRNAPAVYNVPK